MGLVLRKKYSLLGGCGLGLWLIHRCSIVIDDVMMMDWRMVTHLPFLFLCLLGRFDRRCVYLMLHFEPGGAGLAG